ncbi:3-ketoacyl-ACP reductase [Paenibacillus sp. J31TS4]|uniref:SDR family oxidoreductase n=1 Tax=Paenibacillus sp. J31TS4 TaxID=2807195 RepID=UPI001B0F7708|nr:SDR family NAD(P)-dependent oxidoreductase [Paenibacillus sp. J31TS4]GIP40039.1 3-ketoacyl-ACP reductase [Paenibacillus sp. J31TS4]
MADTKQHAEDRAQRVKGMTALVTGAGSGIGRAAALRLAREGARVCLVDLKEEHAADVREEIERAGGEAFVAEADISHGSEVEEAVRRTVDRWGRLDIVFANAGINGKVAPIEHLTEEEWNHTLSTNLNGTFLTVKYAVPHLKERGGSIIITSSINGNRYFKSFGFSAYSTSKAGQVAFMKMAALELAQYKIRVNAICPGAIQTNIDDSTFKSPELDEIVIPVEYPKGQQPLEQGPGSPEQVAELVTFLASPDASHITGTSVYIDGAESLL